MHTCHMQRLSRVLSALDFRETCVFNQLLWTRSCQVCSGPTTSAPAHSNMHMHMQSHKGLAAKLFGSQWPSVPSQACSRCQAQQHWAQSCQHQHAVHKCTLLAHASLPLTTSRRLQCRSSASSSAAATSTSYTPLVKVCGITNEHDALAAVKAGADFLGMIMWPKAKRAVSDATAARIAAVAREHGAQAVGVFVDEDGGTINQRCRAAGVGIAQLHGEPSRAALQDIDADLQVIFVVHATPEGRIITQLPQQLQNDSSSALQRPVQWVLVDGQQGGSGHAFDWNNLQAPVGVATQGWLLAGGLHPGNVAEAVALTQPSAVDVSSGVCGADGLLKDHDKVLAFITAARSCDVLSVSS